MVLRCSRQVQIPLPMLQWHGKARTTAEFTRRGHYLGRALSSHSLECVVPNQVTTKQQYNHPSSITKQKYSSQKYLHVHRGHASQPCAGRHARSACDVHLIVPVVQQQQSHMRSFKHLRSRGRASLLPCGGVQLVTYMRFPSEAHYGESQVWHCVCRQHGLEQVLQQLSSSATEHDWLRKLNPTYRSPTH